MTARPWMRLVEVAEGAAPPADAFPEIVAHALGGVLLRGAVPRPIAEGAAARFEDARPNSRLTMAPVVSGGSVPSIEVLGRSLRLSNWDDYSAAIDPVGAIHRDAFGGEGIEARLLDRVAGLGAGAPRPLRGPGGEPFAASLVTTMRAGATLPFHFDNFCFHEPTAFARAAALLEPDLLINVLTLLAAPTGGGALEWAAIDWDEYVARTGRVDSSAWSDALADGRDVLRIELRPGDVLVFDAGRVAHRVTTVEGERSRVSHVFHLGRD
ncbi:MAG TPA: hypothetical protein VHB21_02700, partial [Minicystis sp.]|nr:hypothetical protein [Minicystis sp.]